MNKGFVICKKVDGYGNDKYVYLEKGIFDSQYSAADVIREIMKEEHLETLREIQEEVAERVEALERGSYITGAHDDISLSITAEIAGDFDSARYGDFFVEEVEIKREVV